MISLILYLLIFAASGALSSTHLEQDNNTGLLNCIEASFDQLKKGSVTDLNHLEFECLKKRPDHLPDVKENTNLNVNATDEITALAKPNLFIDPKQSLLNKSNVFTDFSTSRAGTVANSITFSPPWYLTGHHQGIQNKEFQKIVNEIIGPGRGYYQLWIWHIIPFHSQDYHENTFAYKCSQDILKNKKCTRFTEAVTAINDMNLPVSIEIPVNLWVPRAKQLSFKHYDPDYICNHLNQEDAKIYGRDTARYFFNSAFVNWLINGGRIDHISLDGFIHKLTKGMLYSCGFADWISSAYATFEMVKEWKRLFNDFYSNIPGDNRTPPKFSFIFQVPDWLYRGIEGTGRKNKSGVDYKDVLEFLVNRGILEYQIIFEYLVLDNPYTLFLRHGDLQTTLANFKKMDHIVNDAHRLGMKVSYIANTNVHGDISAEYYPLIEDSYKSEVYKDDSTVLLDTLRYRYRSKIRNYVVQSWHRQPYSYKEMLDLLWRFNYTTKLSGPRVIRNHADPKPIPLVDCSAHEYFTVRPDVRVSCMTVIDHYNNWGRDEGMCLPSENEAHKSGC